MARNPQLFPGDRCPPNLVPTPRLLQRMDQLASESVNAIDGGTWAPSEAIVVGGAGGLNLQNASVSGEVRVGKRGKITMGVSDSVEILTPRMRSILIPLRPSNLIIYRVTGSSVVTPVSSPGFGIRADSYDARGLSFRVAIPRLSLHNGMTALRFTLTLRIGIPPAVMPVSFPEIPAFRIVRVKQDGLTSSDFSPTNVAELYKIPAWQASHAYAVGDVVIPPVPTGYQYRCIIAGISDIAGLPVSTTPGAEQSDSVVSWRTEYGPTSQFNHYAKLAYPHLGSPSDYYRGGTIQQIVLPVNINTTIDTDTYGYVLEVLDPSTRGIPSLVPALNQANIYHSLLVEMSGLTSLTPP